MEVREQETNELSVYDLHADVSLIARLSCRPHPITLPASSVSRWAPFIGSLAIGSPYGSAATPASTCSTSVGRPPRPIGCRSRLLVDFQGPCEAGPQQQ